MKHGIRKWGLILLMSLGFFDPVIAQTTITTSGTAAYWSTSASAIVFGVRNTNPSPIIITDLENYSPANHTSSYSLWYRTNSLTGLPPDITTANGWTQVASVTSTAVATAGIKPLFSGLNVVMPANTTYRFALVASSNGPYYGSSGSSGTLFSGGGVEIYAQGNPNSQTYVGYFPGPVNNTPRTFYGSITFVMAPQNDNAGIGSITDPPASICNGDFDVKAEVKNNGINTLNSVIVNWSVDGVVQSPVNYTTPITPGGNAVVTLGSASFPVGVNRVIKVWTSQPNGTTDSNPADDTVTTTRQATAPPPVSLGNDIPFFCETKNGLELTVDNPGQSRIWNTGDTSKSIIVKDKAGDYWIAVTFSSVCISRDTVNVDVSPLPRVTGMSYVKEDAYTYHFEAAGPQYVDDFLWIFSDNTTDVGPKVSHVFPVGQHHAARLVISNDCGKDSVELHLPLSVGNALYGIDDLAIYPNPASDKIFVKTDDYIKRILIVNNMGAVVYDNQYDVRQAEIAINTSQFATGQYYLRAYMEDNTQKVSVFTIE